MKLHKIVGGSKSDMFFKSALKVRYFICENAIFVYKLIPEL